MIKTITFDNGGVSITRTIFEVVNFGVSNLNEFDTVLTVCSLNNSYNIFRSLNESEFLQLNEYFSREPFDTE